jgi:hypothetical protein
MQSSQFLPLICVAALLLGCSGGEKGTSGEFQLLQFLLSGKQDVPRNSDLEFIFTAPVDPDQDLHERLKIQNVVTTGWSNDFSRAIGIYVCNGETVTFRPQLPENYWRNDAGLKARGDYHVYLKAAPDALRSMTGDPIPEQQEFTFNTSEYFVDIDPLQPPRALRLTAYDPVADTEIDLSRVDPRPLELALLDSNDLLSATDAGGAPAPRAIEPGAGGAPDYATPWEFRLYMSEPLDPQQITRNTVQMYEIRNDALTGDTTADPGHFGNPVEYQVPISAGMVQSFDAAGNYEIYIKITAWQTLVDDARYRLVFSGDILGLDYRETFVGVNGLTGDGQTDIGLGGIYEEAGGLGYTTEFLVYDRPAISSSFTVTYNWWPENIDPEYGYTLPDNVWDDPNWEKHPLMNTALWDPSFDPGHAVGFLGDFGNGQDGPLSASGGQTVEIDTGDTPYADLDPEWDFMGNPFDVFDINPDGTYNQTDTSGGMVTWDTPAPFELQLTSLTVASASTLRVKGVRPIVFRVSGIVQISGTLDIAGRDGQAATSSTATGGEAGAGGGRGGDSKRGIICYNSKAGSQCGPFKNFLNGCPQAKQAGPYSQMGEGPGRGMRGGDSYCYIYDEINIGLTGTGGGGGSHATRGTAGEDRGNVTGQFGQPGPACATSGTNANYWSKNSSVIGVRGQPGSAYGDRDVVDILWGGSGGGAGGAQHIGYQSASVTSSGGAGGGGGGSMTILASGPIIGAGGEIAASGGAGGQGVLQNAYTYYTNYRQATGGGGGGGGGAIVLVSGDDIQMTGTTIDARGGEGGDRANVGTTVVTCNRCNAGGDGGKGFIFMMDKDGEIGGMLPGSPGEYDGHTYGVLTISDFQTDRFSSVSAITELFPVNAADPDYQELQASDVVADVNVGQSIELYASSCPAHPNDPTWPDLEGDGQETAGVKVADIRYAGGPVVVDVVPGGMDGLDTAARDAFVRLRAVFDYTNGVEAALGPFAAMDEVTVRFTFNG